MLRKILNRLLSKIEIRIHLLFEERDKSFTFQGAFYK